MRVRTGLDFFQVLSAQTQFGELGIAIGEELDGYPRASGPVRSDEFRCRDRSK